VFEELSSDKTLIQRDASWKNFSDKIISVSGRVVDVKQSGLLFPANIIIETSEGNQANCFVRDLLKDATMNVAQGSQIACTGMLRNYTLIFGIVSISISEGEFVQ